MIMQGHIKQESYKKEYWIKAGLFYYIPQTLYQVISMFCSLQNPLNNKRFSQEDQVKMFVENFLSSKLAEFYLIYGKRWSKIMVNILEIEIISLLNYS